MSKQKTSTIIEEQLLANGWKPNDFKLIPFTKRIWYRKGVGYMVLRATTPLSEGNFELRLPNKSLILLKAKSIEELEAFERMIISYEPNY